VLGFATYILLDKTNDSLGLTEGIAFAALSAFELLDGPMVVVIDGFEHIQTVINSFRRVQEYLLTEERADYRTSLEDVRPSSRSRISRYQRYDENITAEGSPRSNLVDLELEVIVEDASASYIAEDDPVLQNLSFEIPRGQITMIFGPVGSGKSTLLKLLLGEMPYATGSVATGFTRAAYCPQSPWSTWGTVRSNIVGMSAWDEKWYNTVVSACALLEDFSELANGDQTATGAQGSGLSGGQKMRLVSIHILCSKLLN
jgi:ATP-binding cassette subfamily C (CFTR/MRP) protein 1